MKVSILKSTGAAMALLAFAAAPAMAEMAVSELVLTSGVADREPVDKVASFKAEDNKAFIFARIKNTDVPTKVNFVWYMDNVERARVAMTVGTSGRWRTWSSSNIGTGNWRVDLVDQSGNVLAQKTFTVGNVATAASPAASPAAAPSVAEKPESQPAMSGGTSQ